MALSIMRNFMRAAVAGSLFSVLSLSVISTAHADIIHLYNGKVLHCDVHRITGELIDYRGPVDQGTIKRMQLTNRRDVVETDDRKVFGEIIYMDKFKVEVNTASGLVKLNRWKVNNIVVGTPVQMPVNDTMETIRQQTAPVTSPSGSIVNAPEPGMYNVSDTGTAHHPRVHFPTPYPAVDYATEPEAGMQDVNWQPAPEDSLFPDDEFDRVP